MINTPGTPLNNAHLPGLYQPPHLSPHLKDERDGEALSESVAAQHKAREVVSAGGPLVIADVYGKMECADCGCVGAHFCVGKNQVNGYSSWRGKQYYASIPNSGKPSNLIHGDKGGL